MVDFTPSTLLLEPNAPQWAQRFALRIAKTFQNVFPTQPTRLWSAPSTALPDPASWAGCILYVPDKLKVAVSTGAAWVSAGGGPL
jgi:hypothetical protein